MAKIEFATKRMINAVWTTVFTRVEGGVKILAYSRDFDLGYEKEGELPEGDFIEDSRRTAIELVLRKGDSWRKSNVDVAEERLKIVNPLHIFDYGDKI